MTADVIFIRGIMLRSGTNYLSGLLRLHPDCTRARAPVWEDFLVDEADKLIGYVGAVASHWPAHWGAAADVRRDLLSSLGDGLQDFLRADASTRTVVAKTPSVVGLDDFFMLFPDGPLIVLVRDGRAVTDSAMRSFGWSFERAAHAWRDGAERILAFDRRWRETHGRRYRIVRYEDLVRSLRPTLAPLLEFCGLDPARFDYDAAEELPVRGSSARGTIDTPAGPRPQWRRPVARDASFDPTQRWRQWEPSRLTRFTWIAGDCLRAFGYESEAADMRPGWVLPNHIRDAGWLGRRSARASWRWLKRGVSTMHPPGR